jgi:hypothetical protein
VFLLWTQALEIVRHVEQVLSESVDLVAVRIWIGRRECIREVFCVGSIE